MPPRTATPPRGARHSSPSTRGRGGIQKQRAPFVRTDKDGDALMDAVGRPETRNGRNRGRGASRGGFGGSLDTQQGQQAILRGLDSQGANVIESRSSRGPPRDSGPAVQLRILGLENSKAASNPDGGLKSLLGFLERKAYGMDPKSREAVRIKKSTKEGIYVIITVEPEVSTKMLRMNGFTFAGANLTIEAVPTQFPTLIPKDGEDMSIEAKNTEDRIKAILSTRYDIEMRLLNLSALGEDAGLREMGMFDEKNRISKLFPVLMVICDRLFETPEAKQDAIVSITLADNGLDTVSNVTSLAQTFPDLINLDLSRNRLASLDALSPWRWKLRKLRNLVLIDNPIEKTETSTDYKEEIVRWFPSLQMLNGIQVRNAEQAALMADVENKTQAATHISPIPIRGPDFRDVNQIGERFLKEFFALYDNDRVALANSFYDTQSNVSLSVNVSAPRSKNQSLPSQSWAPYIKHSRNLVKVTNIGPRMSRIYRGVAAIQSLWSELPRTQHPDLVSQTSKYIIDCHPLPGLLDQNGQIQRGVDGLMLMVHGEFEEQNSSGTSAARSFSRAFVLGPGTQNGHSVRVVSDMMVLRAHSPLTLISEEPKFPSQDVVSMEQMRKKEIMDQLMLQTQLTPEFASLCLEGTGWDLEKALLAFQENKATLPPNAFMGSAIMM